MRRFGTRRGALAFNPNTSAAPNLNILPQAGPFATLPSDNINNNPDLLVGSSDTYTVNANSNGNPDRYRNVTIDAGGIVMHNNFSAILWLNSLTVDGSFNVRGEDGSDSVSDLAGSGGNGAAGGGGGAGSDTDSNHFGGDGGISGDGQPGEDGQDYSGAPGGFGFGAIFDTPGYGYPLGGSGENGISGSLPGAGGGGSFGWGGGGGGGGNDTGTNYPGAGAGGSGGLLAIIGNYLIASGSATVDAAGGPGGLDPDGFPSAGGAGGGVVYLAFRHYNGSFSAAGIDVTGAGGATAGNKKIFKINNNNTLTEMSFTDVW